MRSIHLFSTGIGVNRAGSAQGFKTLRVVPAEVRGFRSFAEHSMRTFGFLGLLALTALATVPAISQGIAPDGKIHTRIEGIDIPSVANAPFTAKVVVTWDQPLVGGGTISRQYYTQVARDAQGRVHREIREFVPINSSTDPPLRSFTIIDPVAGSRTSCQMDAMNCTVLDYLLP